MSKPDADSRSSEQDQKQNDCQQAPATKQTPEVNVRQDGHGPLCHVIRAAQERFRPLLPHGRGSARRNSDAFGVPS